MSTPQQQQQAGATTAGAATGQQHPPPSSAAVGVPPQPSSSSAAAAAVAAPHNAHAHVPSVAGSVIEAKDGLGGTCLIRIQNMSATANLGVRLDLKAIALRCRNTEFNPKRFGAVIMRLREPRATALIFASGKMCIAGTKSAHNSMLAAKKFAYIIEKVGFKPQDYIDFKIQNIVGTVDVGFPIRLEGLVYAHSKFASYEPELFPGLIYRLVSPRVVFLIFVSGKIVITGAKTERDLREALTKLHPVLVEYRKASVSPMPGGGGGGGAHQAAAAAASAVAALPAPPLAGTVDAAAAAAQGLLGPGGGGDATGSTEAV